MEEEEKPTIVAGGVDDPFRRFPRFDVAKSPSDHHYLETTDAQVHSPQKQIIIPKVRRIKSIRIIFKILKLSI
jgi:hypothetical protein